MCIMQIYGCCDSIFNLRQYTLYNELQSKMWLPFASLGFRRVLGDDWRWPSLFKEAILKSLDWYFPFPRASEETEVLDIIPFGLG